MRNAMRALIASVALCVIAVPAVAQKKYDPGATDTEIKVGNIMPYSGPASAYGTIGRVQAAYFRMINETGGINGRKVNFISYDDGYSPPKTVEQARKLVEGDEVLLIFQSLGTAPNSAIQKYMNAKKVPQIFVATGATKWGDPKNFPGRWVSSRTTRAKGASTPSTSCSIVRPARSRCCSRTTTTARTCSRA
jgi:branched-chain amino acid transport system substrate-binding protein